MATHECPPGLCDFEDHVSLPLEVCLGFGYSFGDLLLEEIPKAFVGTYLGAMLVAVAERLLYDLPHDSRM